MAMPTRQELIEQAQRARMPRGKKAAEPPPKRSDSLQDKMKDYKKQVKVYLSRPENLRCKIQAPGCKVISTCVHHTAGRTGKQLTNEEDWMPSCTPCNSWVESNDREAREKGFKKTRLGKVKKGAQ